MKALEFSIDIHASSAKVWHVLFSKFHYPKWTEVFCEGSYAISDWKEGSKIEFMAPNGNGVHGRIKTNEAHKHMVFEHLGEIKDYMEMPASEEVESWTGALEQYHLSEANGVTTLVVNMDSLESNAPYFEVKFPEGLERVKQMSEQFRVGVVATLAMSAEKAWHYWTTPEHIMQWNHASDDWHCPASTMDLRVGGTMSSTMAAKDGSFSFDFMGEIEQVVPFQQIVIKLGDGRKMELQFEEKDGKTLVTETFEVEDENSIELQETGWQAILNNYKQHAESKG